MAALLHSISLHLFFRTEHAEFRGWIRFAGFCDSLSVGGSPGPRGPASASVPAGNRPARLLPGARAVPGKPVWPGGWGAACILLGFEKHPSQQKWNLYFPELTCRSQGCCCYNSHSFILFPLPHHGTFSGFFHYLSKRSHQGLKDADTKRNQLKAYRSMKVFSYLGNIPFTQEDYG